jgi:4-amino-4-deoxy-L-arabinose transferase-like glycosyltransferase
MARQRAEHGRWTAFWAERGPLVALLALAAGVRLWGIARESLWLDEATSLLLARMDLRSLIAWTANDIHPPLYYLLLHFWVPLGQSELVLRGFSALAGVLTVGVLYGLGKTLVDRELGLWAAFVLALSPLHVWYSQEARMYALLTLLYTTSLWLALRLWQRPSGRRWAAYVLVTAATLYTHYYAVFAILIENLFLFYLYFRRGRPSGLLRAWLLAQATVALLFVPWMPRFLANLGGGGGWLAFSQGPPSLLVFPQTAILYAVGTAREYLPEMVRRLAYLVVGLALAAGLWPLVAERRQAAQGELGALLTRREASVFCLVSLMLPPASAWVASQVFKPMYSARYMLPFLPAFVLLLAWGLRCLRQRWARAALLTALSIVMGLSLVTQVAVLEKPDWRGLAHQMVARAEPGDAVLFVPSWHAGPFAYYAGDAMPLYDQMPAMVAETPDASLQYVRAALAAHPRLWFVWETGHYTDPQGRVYGLLRETLQEVDHQVLLDFGDLYLFEHLSQPIEGGDG